MAKNLKSVNEILDFAIKREEEAVKFYKGLARKVDRPWMKETLDDFAREEQGHKAKLQAVKKGKLLLSATEKVADLKIGDYLVDVEPTRDMNYQQILILAMKKEKAAFKLYTDLAASTDKAELRVTLLSLANEEAKHKLRLEVEYDDYVMKEN
ncbi:MAG: rubrerythrin [Planctomycetes bacterium]|nr:rubrerythrin [Planctomycetota bacterium]MBM4080357.1 rubrerythrin [Planctomycetota bacterium]